VRYHSISSFFFNDTATTEIYTLSLHDALPISEGKIAIGPPIEDGFYYDFDLPRALTPDDLSDIEERMRKIIKGKHNFVYREVSRSEEHTSELQSRENLVCRLLLEKKKKNKYRK